MNEALISDIVQFVKSERQVIKMPELVQEIMQAARANPAWQRATYEQWERAAEMAIIRGLLVRESNTIWFPVVSKGPKETQRELF